jgi:aryl-alcohol dehydrogenase-like predicted oxidoreductase
MQLTGAGVWGPPTDRAGAVAVLRRAVELGVDLLDTADSYGPDVAEELLAEALAPYPEGLCIATKAGLTRPGPDQWVPRGDPAWLRRQCEGSLRRLGVERIDLWQLHRIDPAVPREEQFGVLRELLDEGKVAAVGLSEVGIDDIEAARAVVPVATVQNHYNLGNRTGDAVVDHCTDAGIGFIPWFPLGSGALCRPGGPLDSIATEIGATPSEVALAWLLRRSPVMLPIPGTSSLGHLESNCAAAALELSDAHYEQLVGDRKALRRWAMTGAGG